MKLLGALGLCALAFALPARGDSALQLSQPQIDTLTPIDTVPSPQQINSVFNNDPDLALSNLLDIANPSGAVDTGVQLRAIRALAGYCATTPCTNGDPAQTTLRAIIQRYANAAAGSDLLVLRAAIESLGLLRVQTDEPLLEERLSHPSRDIRATTAHALRDLGNTQAITALQERYDHEDTDQVKQAISDALRVLDGQPVP